jgi:hypothetical protein
MKTFLNVLATIALVAVVAFFFTFFLIILAVLLAASAVVLLIWMINGTPFYIKKNGEVVAVYKRFKRIK